MKKLSVAISAIPHFALFIACSLFGATGVSATMIRYQWSYTGLGGGRATGELQADGDDGAGFLQNVSGVTMSIWDVDTFVWSPLLTVTPSIWQPVRIPSDGGTVGLDFIFDATYNDYPAYFYMHNSHSAETSYDYYESEIGFLGSGGRLHDMESGGTRVNWSIAKVPDEGETWRLFLVAAVPLIGVFRIRKLRLAGTRP